ncbi:hypothetical protein [Halobacillus seohaensis]|uniref:Uncharacterized protein n=1 Tax=Halobacillus seohaensis TaxID=447421 RepID=A0ABW2EMZ6_9BACI
MKINENLYNQENDDAAEILSRKHMIGFILCIMLTSFSLWGALYSSYTPRPLLFVLAAFAFSQAMMQLLCVQSAPKKAIK